MKRTHFLILISSILIVACSSQKKLETSAPFTLGEVYGQNWIVENAAKDSGYEVVIPVMSLDENEAVLQNLYHKGKMVDISIELRDFGMIALAEYSKEDLLKKDILVPEAPNSKKKKDNKKMELFPFELRDTEAVLSYLQKDKVKYIKLSGIRQNPVVIYESLKARR
ncbi:hypothetical protein FEE95_05595 [Maribacter algarum]|uniref:Uncharacterized protein n=1 Tax=Maribacter algarum (ex Zhang et al. 2020) TaxID=2578118 RepID=A0A5S3PV94_9FLAO|nr:hypothetical protein [Maribacter algarum]TMM58905.1 hypothetical protein FEE95_05595 [Maribacter algarum]